MAVAYWVARAIENVSIVVMDPIVVDKLVNCMTPDVVPTLKTNRFKEVLDDPASTALAINTP
jgi:hypothetical protein